VHNRHERLHQAALNQCRAAVARRAIAARSSTAQAEQDQLKQVLNVAVRHVVEIVDGVACADVVQQHEPQRHGCASHAHRSCNRLA
jgi:hypothetical protein